MMADRTGRSPLIVVAAAALLMFAMGTLYAWSVFIRPLEIALSATRAEVSAIFSLATVSFTVGMLTAPLFYRHASASRLTLAAATAAFLGHLLAAGLKPAMLAAGYGVMFGYANGFGYSIAIQSVQLLGGRRRGRWTGFIVACHTLGAACSAPALEWLIGALGPSGTLALVGSALLATGASSALLLRLGGLRTLNRVGPAQESGSRPGTFLLMWAAMMLGSLAGVFALGHAAGIQAEPAGLAATLVALGNGIGRLLGGWSDEAGQPNRSVAALQVVSAAAFVAMAGGTSEGALFACLFATGIGYGWLAGAYPLIVARYWGVERVGQVYGRLITAWGFAAMLGPWLGGWLFDRTGSYRLALGGAAVAALAAGLSMLFLPSPRQRPRAPEA